MSVDARSVKADDAASIATWRAVAAKAPAIARRVRIVQLGWTTLILLGAIPTLAISKYSLHSSYWPGLLDLAIHVGAMGLASLGSPYRQWFTAAGTDPLPRLASRAARFTILRRILMIEAAILVVPPPLRTLMADEPLRWGWPATLSVAMLLIGWAIERILHAELREHERLLATDASGA